MPSLFAFSIKVLANGQVAYLAAFGSFALLLLAEFTGPMRNRLRAQAALSVAGLGLVCLGTLVSQVTWLAAVSMAAVGFVAIFAGVVSSVVASATTSLLLTFVVPVSISGPVSAIPDRAAGFAMASGAAFLAVWLLWPAPARNALRSSTVPALREIASRASSAGAGSGAAARSGAAAGAAAGTGLVADAGRQAVAGGQAGTAKDGALAALERTFVATPSRPTSLGTSARAVVRLVDELLWLGALTDGAAGTGRVPVSSQAINVRVAAARVLDSGAELLAAPDGRTEDFQAARVVLAKALDEMESDAIEHLPVSRRAARSSELPVTGTGAEEFVSSLDPGFRAQEIALVTAQIAANIDIAVAADRRPWHEAVLGREPGGMPSAFQAARERALAHLERHSVWLHNSLRGAVGLALAVFIAKEAGLQHAFWVTFATLSVLRSNALNTGQNVLRAMSGTVVGFVVGGALIELVGHNTDVLWAVLPFSILISGFAPSAISYLAGQVAFTVNLVILFNLIAPAGWRIGLVRVEDVAIACGVSLGVGLLFWPRGAGSALGDALDEAYSESASYLSAAITYGIGLCDACIPSTPVPGEQAVRAAAASRRLDDAFRTYLAERGPKPVPLAEISSLLMGVVALRQSAQSVVDLWQRDEAIPAGDRGDARAQLSFEADRTAKWYRQLGAALAGQGEVPEPGLSDGALFRRVASTVRHDLQGDDGHATATAVRIIWTADHLDAAQRLETTLVGPARAAFQARADRLLGFDLPFHRNNGAS